MLEDLGKALHGARTDKGWSLAVAAQPARISAAYLHKLEQGRVGSPSPRVLARLAAVLEVPYLRLMELAGYLDEPQLAEVRARSVAPGAHPLAGQQLSSEEWAAVGTFIRELIAKRDRQPHRTA